MSATADKLKDLATLGYVTFPGLFSPAQAKTALDKIHALYKSGGDFPHHDGVVIENLQNKDPWFIDLLAHPDLDPVLMGLLNDPYYRPIPADQPNYILSEFIARATTDEKLRLHIDSWIPAPGPRTWMVQLAIALEDRGVAEGCSVVVPGSHLSGDYADREKAQPVAVPLKAGDAALWDSRLWHGTTPRTSSRMGWALIATYQMWWVKQRFDIPAALPAETYRKLTDRQKALLGYCSLPPHDEHDGVQKKGYTDLKDR